MAEFSYSKKDKLKSKTDIDLLFSKGLSLKKYPIRIIYYLEDSDQKTKKIGVSVSKRYFKKAVDRNRIKRLLREAYRLNQQLVSWPENKKLIMMILYQNHSKTNFHFLNSRMIEALQLLNKNSNANP